MKWQVEVEGRERTIELRREGDGWGCSIDGQARAVDVVEVRPGVLSVLLDGQSFTLRVERAGAGYSVGTRAGTLTAQVDNPRRWRGRAGSGLRGGGRQEVAAPMAGKVVRVLVEENQPVAEGQGLVVVEAMKMQNEIPSPKAGVIEKVLAQEGATVDHGAVLIVVA
ncbi:MAG: biotin/lipoyl-containing protein [Terriglobia bacterium]